LPAGEQAGDLAGHLRIPIDAHPAHDVVRRRPDLHRLLGDIDVAQLLELVVHAGQLLLPVLGRVEAGHALLYPRGEALQLEEYPAVRAAAALLDLANDAAGDVVARQQLRRAARVLA